jgi:uncharacterized membrane protein
MHFGVFFFLTFVISWSYETSSMLTGFPFGHYVYTDKLGPKLWLVPLLIACLFLNGIHRVDARTCSSRSV